MTKTVTRICIFSPDLTLEVGTEIARSGGLRDKACEIGP